MKRLLALGLGIALAGAAAAQTGNPGTPLFPAPATPVQATPATPWPTAPTVPQTCNPATGCAATPSSGFGLGFGLGGDVPCGTPLFPGVGPKPGDRTCLNKFLDFVCYKPGPSVLPVLTPTPFHAPLRTYFPCKPDANCAPPCAPEVEKVRPAPNNGFRLVNMPESECRKPLLSDFRKDECRKPLLQGACSPRFLNGGLFVRSPGCCPSQGPVAYGAVPRPVPLFSGCETCGGGFTGFGRLGSVLDGCLGWLMPGRTSSSYAGAEMSPGCNGANCYPTGIPGPTLAGYRFANPVGHPAQMGAYPGSYQGAPAVTPVYQQQISAVPFTNP
jgi:hypothetical protein